MLKWGFIFCLIPSIILGQESKNQQSPLTIQEMLEKDRFEWRTITLTKPSPSPPPIPSTPPVWSLRNNLKRESLLC